MEDGVIQVYANKDCKMLDCFIILGLLMCPFWVIIICAISHLLSPATEKLFPVADATTFFTDLHHILKVIAAGNIRTLCHHRLVLLEQVKDLPVNSCSSGLFEAFLLRS